MFEPERNQNQNRNRRSKGIRLIEDRLGTRAQVYGGERAILVGLDLGFSASWEEQESMEELVALSETAGVVVLGTLIQRRSKPDPAYFLGEGKVEQLKALVEKTGADTVIVNDALSPAQERNLEERLQRKIIDRPQLIMSIFAQHARTKEAQLQVELAQLEYLLPRLRGWGQALSQLGGGIGTRGPGETQMEKERRRIKRRIYAIRERLREVERERRVKRHLRQRRHLPVIALIGYTNTGKTTLLTKLSPTAATNDSGLIADQLFATLDPLARRLELPDGREAVLIDTVGFIKKLPHQLIPAFQATLEAVEEADLLLHVLDLAHPRLFDQLETVNRVLQELFEDRPRPPLINVLNKLDQLDLESEADRGRLEQARREIPNAVFVSALTGEGLEELRERIAQELEARWERLVLNIPYEKGYLLDELHRYGEVHREEYGPAGVRVEVTLECHRAAELQRALH